MQDVCGVSAVIDLMFSIMDRILRLRITVYTRFAVSVIGLVLLDLYGNIWYMDGNG